MSSSTFHTLKHADECRTGERVLEESYRTIVDQAKNNKHKPARIFIGRKSMGGRIASQIAANGVEVNGLFFLGCLSASQKGSEQELF
jgi:predicted alpha/beta-hydrolase family hydrolase